jgi:hypothetical protein
MGSCGVEGRWVELSQFTVLPELESASQLPLKHVDGIASTKTACLRLHVRHEDTKLVELKMCDLFMHLHHSVNDQPIPAGKEIVPTTQLLSRDARHVS